MKDIIRIHVDMCVEETNDDGSQLVSLGAGATLLPSGVPLCMFYGTGIVPPPQLIKNIGATNLISNQTKRETRLKIWLNKLKKEHNCEFVFVAHPPRYTPEERNYYLQCFLDGPPNINPALSGDIYAEPVAEQKLINEE